ncbi:MAG TPA: NADH-quinone oxidoreductase subunit A [Thermoanaerobaculia bacterium]|nr:NADH-quinone oxidoreductase subunit A [Thermoanaerobaculia bacterium]
MPETYFPVLLGIAAALVIGGAIVLLSWWAGPKTGGRIKLSTYESGMPLLDRSRKRLSIAFFLVAIDFVIFDVEAAFLFPWALVAREGGWPLFWAVMIFFALLVVGFLYVWLKGGLDVGLQRSFVHDPHVPGDAAAARAQREAA